MLRRTGSIVHERGTVTCFYFKNSASWLKEFYDRFILKNGASSKSNIVSRKNNLYGHPHKETIKRLQKNGADIYGTLWGGAIHIESNGQKYQINYFKNQ
ncbi:MAG: hypothetical protein ACLVIY_13605 [Anaerobutyricum soehngenii]